MKINIAIDGPSAAGKSTIADILADKLGYNHLDTGAMYRAVAFESFKEGIAIDDEENIVNMINNMKLDMRLDGKVVLNGEDISNKIRTNEISMGASNVSKLLKVRAALVKMQQDICKQGGFILDGRDIGTVVLKDAPVKLFMTASAEARAKRRVDQNREKGIEGDDYDTILQDIIKRDYQDSHRENSPLKQADDAVLIDTSDLTIEETLEKVMSLVKEKIGE